MADRMVLYRRRIYQVSALSTFDGSLCAYHGCNGASLVPAAAVIPALKVYIVIAAVKKLVVGSASQDLVHPLDEN
ncbi:unnamed protein product [Brugia pahangi]|uniref:GMC_oxred_C domain-containing protein n=1 Tax=Brugia pahangi TaxID=6280 RepID=A0A0N4U048_BRUPA|nr:unnamed protein product [Brugia pahangi]